MTEDQNGIRLQQTMSRADYSALRAHYMYRVKKGRMPRLLGALAFFALAAGLGHMAFLPKALYYLGVCGICVMTFILIFIDAQARKLEKPGKSIGNRSQTLLLTEEGFEVEWLNYAVPLQYNWDTVVLAGEGEHHYFLYVAKLAAIIIPKRGLKPEKLAAVHELIQRKTPLMQHEAKEKTFE
ncbi:MAG: YcxB family protein [Eubacteriales bacterium]|nr:YcxB family protein [Eubacteriales bacterium]